MSAREISLWIRREHPRLSVSAEGKAQIMGQRGMSWRPRCFESSSSQYRQARVKVRYVKGPTRARELES